MAARRSSALTLLVLGASLMLVLKLAASPAFLPAPTAEAGTSRREMFSLGAAGALAMTASRADAANLPGLPEQKEQFDVDPKEAIIVGDIMAPEAVAAKKEVERLLKQAQQLQTALEKNPQEDLTDAVEAFGVAELRLATNTINNLMDETTAAGTQRLQRLMINDKTLLEEEIPFPVTKKGRVQPRGVARLERIQEALKRYITNSNNLLKFMEV